MFKTLQCVPLKSSRFTPSAVAPEVQFAWLDSLLRCLVYRWTFYRQVRFLTVREDLLHVPVTCPFHIPYESHVFEITMTLIECRKRHKSRQYLSRGLTAVCGSRCETHTCHVVTLSYILLRELLCDIKSLYALSRCASSTRQACYLPLCSVFCLDTATISSH